MARRKASKQEFVEETVVRHTTVRQWQPHATESLPQIHRAIDSWGRRTGQAEAPTYAERTIDPAHLESQVDRVTRRVKGSRQVVVHETVTEWVEGPAGSGPIAVEEEVVPTREFHEVEPGTEEDALPSAQVGPLRHAGKRPRRRFGFFGRRGEAAEPEKRVPVGDKDYQPQCAALTDDGAQCRNSARGTSRYCSSHKGYQPPTAKGLAQRIEGDAWDPRDNVTDRESVATADTRPRVRRAPDTKVKVRKASKRRGR